jgi:hypothetical protein
MKLKMNSEKTTKNKTLNQEMHHLLVRIPRIQLLRPKVIDFNDNFTHLSKPGAYSKKSMKYMDGKTNKKLLRKNETYSIHKKNQKTKNCGSIPKTNITNGFG